MTRPEPASRRIAASCASRSPPGNQAPARSDRRSPNWPPLTTSAVRPPHRAPAPGAGRARHHTSATRAHRPQPSTARVEPVHLRVPGVHRVRDRRRVGDRRREPGPRPVRRVPARRAHHAPGRRRRTAQPRPDLGHPRRPPTRPLRRRQPGDHLRCLLRPATRRGHRAGRTRGHHSRGHPQGSRLRTDLRRRRDHHSNADAGRGRPTRHPARHTVAEHRRIGYTAEDRPVRLMVSVIPGDTIVLRYVVAT
jgi:hypothetical protein